MSLKTITANPTKLGSFLLNSGSNVEILWKAGEKHPTHGVATYLTAIKVADEHEEGFKSKPNEELEEFWA